MDDQNPFTWLHFETDSILLCVRWYVRYSLSYRGLEEMMRERGLHVDHTTIYRWVQHYETYVKVKKGWMDLYRAVDSQSNTLEFLLSPTRDAEAAKGFFSKTLAAPHTTTPRVITVDTHAAYPKAIRELKAEGIVPEACELTSASST